jgi:superfamily II DNA or RNA helicase
VFSLVRRLERYKDFDIIVIDEAHHSCAVTWRKILDALPNTRRLGVTATPERLDGKGVDDIFDKLICGPAVAELIRQGYLSPFTAFVPTHRPNLAGVRTQMGDYVTSELSRAMSKGVVITAAVDEYEQRCLGSDGKPLLPTIAYCVDIAHSTLVAMAFCERGYKAIHLDGDTSTDRRRAIIKARIGSLPIKRGACVRVGEPVVEHIAGVVKD